MRKLLSRVYHYFVSCFHTISKVSRIRSAFILAFLAGEHFEYREWIRRIVILGFSKPLILPDEREPFSSGNLEVGSDVRVRPGEYVIFKELIMKICHNTLKLNLKLPVSIL